MIIKTIADEILDVLSKSDGLTAEEIANIIGVDEEVVNEIMRIFEERNVVVTDYGIMNNKHRVDNVDFDIMDLKRVILDEDSVNFNEYVRI